MEAQSLRSFEQFVMDTYGGPVPTLTGQEGTRDLMRSNFMKYARAYAEYKRRYLIQRLEAGLSLLPYDTPGPWIATGPSKFAHTLDGSVTVERSAIRVRDDDGTTVNEGPPEQVAVRRVWIWFGMGVRLDFPTGQHWYVQPDWAARGIRRSRLGNRVFRAALREAGAQISGS